ncbi:50S ribosomal protein L17 [Naasia lichenicola]|uniref:Large ribosomal subunit protein bL17 n=1 Tax=Naasia lichenicola TaxID=2565933 RepID=A0A4S4FKN5_9MICO|nr:50S ribosomal protein L17 [Naasia lichenicola]THG29736.1 50S ribosomal protein L17 [Naasia lichenicola]
MPRPSKGPRLGGGPAHERLLLSNLAIALITHKAITTTETKAKRLQPLADRLVTFGKRGDLHARRRALSIIPDKQAVYELFDQIAPLVNERAGGYTRITKTGYRKGDNAPMAVIELVLEPVVSKRKPVTPKAAAAASAATPAATAAPSDEPVVTDAEASVDEAAGGSDEPTEVESTDAVETSEPTPAEDETPAATEVEADAEKAAEPDSK